jgi:tyrosinase
VPAAGTPDVVDLGETMKPWNDVRPPELLDHTALYTFDAA